MSFIQFASIVTIVLLWFFGLTTAIVEIADDHKNAHISAWICVGVSSALLISGACGVFG